MSVDRSVFSPSKILFLFVLLLPGSASARSSAAIRAFNEGVKCFNAKEFNAAIPHFDEALSGDAEFEEAYFARGACRYYLKSMDGALLDLNQAVRLKPDDSQARSLRGAVHYEADHWDDALADFNVALQKNSQDAQSLLGRAVILLKRENLNAAARDFKAFLRLRPDDPVAPKVRELLASLKQQSPQESEASTTHTAPTAKALSQADFQKMTDGLLSHSLNASYEQQVLRGEKGQAVGDIHSVPSVPKERKNSETSVEIVDPQ